MSRPAPNLRTIKAAIARPDADSKRVGEEPPDYRRGRTFKSAYATAAAAKFVTLAVEALALPLAARALGTERFGALMILAAVTTFWVLIPQGISPAASIMVARARGDERGVRETFWAFAILATLVGLAVGALAALSAVLLPTSIVFGQTHHLPESELRSGMASVALYSCLFSAFWWAEGCAAGFLKNHLTNLFTLLSSVVILVGVLLLTYTNASVSAYFSMLFLPRPILRGFNLAVIAIAERKALSRPVFSKDHFAEALHRSRKFSVGMLGINLQLQGSVYLVAQIYGLGAGAIVGGVARLLNLINSTVMSILTPLLPTVKIAIARNDLRWAVRACKATLVMGLAIAGSVALAFALAGQRLMTVWLHLDVHLGGATFLALGLFAFAHLFSIALYILQGSMFEAQKTGQSLLVSALLGLAVGLALSRYTGPAGIFFAGAFSLLVFVTLPLSREILELLGSWRSRATPGAFAN